MIKKILQELKNHYIYYSILLVILLSNIISLDYEIYSPGSLDNLSDRIVIDSEYTSNGSFNLTYVTSRKGTLFNLALSYIIPNWDIIDLDESRIENESDDEIFQRGQVYLKMTSYDAIIAAFKEANIDYEIENVNLTVSYIYSSAKTNLEIGDIITKIDNNSIDSYETLKSEISKYKENDKISITVKRNNKEKECYAILQKEEDNLVIGVYIANLYDVKTSPSVEYLFEDNESGSSRGLMCALEIYNRITEFDLTKGKTIAGTGTIDENGNIGSIDGVKYKLIGAVKNNADIFIVPSENYDEAVKVKEENNFNIEIIKTDTLKEIIEKLNNL